MYRRSRLGIYFDVLHVIHSGTYKPTRIMYEANLSWSPLREMFKTLLDRGFIHVKAEGKTKRYFLTEKGTRALSYHLKSLNAFRKLRTPSVDTIRNYSGRNPILALTP